ncbi:MAG: cupin domain-containing protein [Thermoclostridium sp.]|nr:cupin domain-containing protein [Thermoclostridium sp.]
MPRIFNTNNMSFEQRKSPIPEFCWHTSPDLSELTKSKVLKFNIRSLDPGKFSYPYHSHRNAEEMFVILSGSVTLRTPEEYRVLSQGDIVFFEMGPEGAHQVYNHTDKPCQFLDIRTDLGLDVCDYPDSGKINVLPYRDIFQAETAVDYYQGEENISKKWPEEIVNKK